LKEEIKTFIIYAIIFGVLEIVFYYVFTSDLLSGLYYTESFRVFLFVMKDGIGYFLFGLLAFFVAIILPKVFCGSVVDRLSSAFGVLGVILMVQLMLTSTFVPLQIQELSGLIFISELVILGFATGYYIFKDYDQRFLPEIVQASAFIVGAFLVWEIIVKLPIDYNTHIATAAAVGLGFAGLSVLFYPLRLSNNQILKKLGVWFSSSTSRKFFMGFFLTLYLSLMRPYIFDLNSEFLLLGEWVGIGLITAGSLLWVRSNLRPPESEGIYNQYLANKNAPKKHKQMIITSSTEEMKTIKEYVDDFVVEGMKSDVLLFITKSSFEKGLTFYKLHNVLEDFINYQDLPMPRFSFLKEVELVKKENFENRRKILRSTIEKMNEAYRSM